MKASLPDPDGNNTLSGYRIALNDTTDPARWFTVPTRDTIVTLVVPRLRSDGATGEVTADVYSGKFVGRRFLGTIRGLRLNQLNTLYLQAKDVAGEYSPAIRMPSGTARWYVRKPVGRLFLVSDYINFDAAQALAAYRTSLDAVPGGQFAEVDQLDAGRGLTPEDKRNGKYGSNFAQSLNSTLKRSSSSTRLRSGRRVQWISLGSVRLSACPLIARL